MFTFGLFLFKMKNRDLRLLAGYGFAKNTSSILLMSGIGNWIDQTAREFFKDKIILEIENVKVIMIMMKCILLSF